MYLLPPLRLLVDGETVGAPAVLRITTTAEHTVAGLIQTGSRSESRTAEALRSILRPGHWRSLAGAKALADFVGHAIARVRRAAQSAHAGGLVCAAHIRPPVGSRSDSWAGVGSQDCRLRNASGADEVGQSSLLRAGRYGDAAR